MSDTKKGFPRCAPLTPVPGPENFTDEEEITRPDGRAARSAMLVADWNACEPEQQLFLERTARRFADIVRARKPNPNGRY